MSKLTRCIITVAKLESFPGYYAGGYTKKKADGSPEFISGRFFPNGKTVCELDDDAIESIKHDEASGHRIAILVDGDDAAITAELTAAPEGEGDKKGEEKASPGKPISASTAAKKTGEAK